MYTKTVDIVLLEDIPFKELLPKIEKVFKTSLPFENKKGRHIAKSCVQYLNVEVIDRYDDLSGLLCDDYHTLVLTFFYEGSLDYLEKEKYVKEILKNLIMWDYGIWSPIEKGEPYRKIFPNKETEIFYIN
ncbi:hypothetical protein [Sphingobacterium sp. MYb382]|uniref:hypothetical protein n=1 Tax=Sphingobacterium sp. MYb382 TaxID=2745278 RepID=UPI0030A1850B